VEVVGHAAIFSPDRPPRATLTAVETVAGAFLVVLPVAYTVVIAGLARTFDYPGMLRRPTAEVLARVRAGGTRLVWLWWAFAMCAVLFVPTSTLLVSSMSEVSGELRATIVAIGVLAAVVQLLGLVRWSFVVPWLAREAVGASEARTEAIDVAFQSLNRSLGVAIGEHLVFLLTGVWTALTGAAMLAPGGLPVWLGVVGLPIGVALVVCSVEFVGPFERDGWAFAARLEPIAFAAWSAWLLTVGLVVLVMR
jgi:hypothetical protein